LTNNLRIKVDEAVHDLPIPSISVTLDVAIRHGVDDIRTHEDVRTILVLRRQIDSCDEWGVREVEALASWFRSFPFSIPNDSLSPTRRVNIKLTTVTKAALFTLAEHLGIPATSLAVLSIIQTFSLQSDTFPPNRIRLLESEINSWLGGVGLRREVGEVLVRGMEEMYGPRTRRVG
jgi:hypothetical protein